MSNLWIPSYKQGFARCAAESENPNLRKGLAGLWAPYLGPTGLTLFDWAGRKNHGLLTNMDPATDWVTSPYGGALDFDGGNNAVVLEQQPIGAAEISLSCWLLVRTLGTSNLGRIFDNGKFLVFVRFAPNNVSVSSDGATLWDCVTGIVADTWCHLVITRSGNNSKLYLDGTYVGTGATGVPALGTTAATIGNRAAANRGWDGAFNCVILYNRILGLDEIQILSRDPHAHTRPKRLILPSAAAPAAGNPWWYYQHASLGAA